MKRATLFLTGRYKAADITAFKKLCRGSYLIAVDGGTRFFTQTGLKPDLIIGDFDSTSLSVASLKRRFPQAEIVEHPPLKDKTDLHLAVDICLERQFSQIDIIQPSKGEIDHLLGNLTLLEYLHRRHPAVSARLIGPDYEARLLCNGRKSISNAKGCGLSIVPVSKQILLTSGGVAYPSERLLVRRGESRALRNRISSQRAWVEIEGTAFLIRLKRS